MTFVSIIHDVKILNYYIYSNLHFVNKEWTDDGHGTINFPDLRIGVPYIIKEIRALEDVILFGNEISSQKSGEDNVHISVKTYQGHTYGFAVNTKHKAVNQKIQVGENVKKLMVISEARTIEVNEGSFSDDFAPYGTHLYTDDPAFRDLTPLNKIESEIKTAGGKFSVPYKK